MKKQIYYLLIVPLCLSSFGANAQEKPGDGPFVPNGKPFTNVFGNCHYNFGNSAKSPAFEITRAYLGYAHQFGNKLSSKVCIDVCNPNNPSDSSYSNLQYTAYLKFASLQYNTGKLSVDFGMIGLNQFSLQRKYWGRRYIYKTFQNQNKFGHTADLGLSAVYSVTKSLSLDAAITNGEGYKQVQADNTLRTSLATTLMLGKNLVSRIYCDFYGKGATQSTLSLFCGYSVDGKLLLGAEYALQYSNKQVVGNNWGGFSVFAAYELNNKFGLFGRFDRLASSGNKWTNAEDPDHPWNYKKDGTLAISGVEFNPAKNVKLALNYQGFYGKMPGSTPNNAVYLNFEFKN